MCLCDTFTYLYIIQMKMIDANYLWIWQFCPAPTILILPAEEINKIWADEKYSFTSLNVLKSQPNHCITKIAKELGFDSWITDWKQLFWKKMQFL